MKPTEIITYRGIEYPVFDVRICDEGETKDVRVGTTDLSEALIPDDDCFNAYQDDEAEAIDESIFYFITEEVAALSEEEIVKHIEDYL